MKWVMAAVQREVKWRVLRLDQVPCSLLVVIGAGILSRDTKDEDKEDAGKLNYTLIV